MNSETTKFKADVVANTQCLGPGLPHLVDADKRGRPGDVEGEDAPVLVQVAPLQTDRLTLSTTPLSLDLAPCLARGCKILLTQ